MLVSELSARSGCSVPTIKFYIREGLLPAGEARSRTRATYDESHLSRLRLIRALLDVGGLSLATARAVIEVMEAGEVDHHDLVRQALYALGPERIDDEPDQVQARADVVTLVGDFLFARSFNLMVETGDIQVLDILARAASVIAEGEVMQLAAANDADTTRERYMQIIAAKTAALFAAAAKSGAVAAGRPGEEATALETFGRELGLAFQLVDDALDYGGLTATMGKNSGDDLREGKFTLPVVFAREAGDDGERAFWRRAMGGERSDDDFHRAVALLKRHNAIAKTLEAARQHAANATTALLTLPANAYREALEALPEFVVERAY